MPSTSWGGRAPDAQGITTGVVDFLDRAVERTRECQRRRPGPLSWADLPAVVEALIDAVLSVYALRMPSRPGRPDRNFLLLLGDGGLFSLAIVCFDPAVVLSLFVATLTSSPLLIGAPAAIKLAGLYLPQLPVAIGVRNFQRIKPFFFWQALVGRGALIGIIAAAALSRSIPAELSLLVVLLAWVVFSFTEGAATLAWLDLVGDVIHLRRRGSYFGAVQFLGGALAVIAGFGVQSAMTAEITPSAFIPIFAWGFVAFGLSVICIGFVRDEHHAPRAPAAEAPAIVQHLRNLLRGTAIRRVSVAQILAGSIQFGLPFYAIFAHDRLGLSGEWLGSLIVAQTLGLSAAGAGVARLAGHYGARTVVCLSSALLVVIPICCLLAEVLRLDVLVLVAFFLAGASRGASQAGFWQYVLDLVPTSDRRLFMGLANTANAPILLMPLLGGIVLSVGSFESLFAGSMLLAIAAIVAAFALPTPGDPRVRTTNPAAAVADCLQGGGMP
jgi:Major Facilitator Superfamily